MRCSRTSVLISGVKVVHILILREVLELAADGLAFSDVQLLVDVESVDDEEDEEDEEDDVDHEGHLSCVEDPHQQERREMEAQEECHEAIEALC